MAFAVDWMLVGVCLRLKKKMLCTCVCVLKTSIHLYLQDSCNFTIKSNVTVIQETNFVLHMEFVSILLSFIYLLNCCLKKLTTLTDRSPEMAIDLGGGGGGGG